MPWASRLGLGADHPLMGVLDAAWFGGLRAASPASRPVRYRCGPGAEGCTAGFACRYGIGVGRFAAAAAGGGHGFPAALTSFIGRDGPVREVAGLLDQCRLVTVTGPGGSGKTRLAAEVAKRVAERFADGIWLAELAQVADPALVAGVVAAALGVRGQRFPVYR